MIGKLQRVPLRLSRDIMEDLKRNSHVLAQHYGFTDEELDFIINHDIKYRMGDELFYDGEEEEE
jgi:hypothetical protein